MINDASIPRFLSFEFHTTFLPRVLKDRLCRKKKESPGTTFTSTTEMIIGMAVCIILAVIGIPSAWTQGSIVGWILSIVGVGGIVVLVILSIGGQRGDHPTYDDFLAGIFLLCVCLGLFIGIPIGMAHHSVWLGLLGSLIGVLAGYVAGVFAGLWLQHLGWIAVILNMLAALAALALCSTALIMLLVSVL
jgi:hypothetical protein